MEFETLVFEAARDGKLYLLQVLLDGKSRESIFSFVSARTKGSTPLVMACTNGHLDVARYLIESCNADIEQAGLTTYENGMEILVATPLVCAATGGHINIVEMLVKYNASINSSTPDDSCTAIYMACFCGHFEIAKYLIQHGADIEKTTSMGSTCLMAACCKGHCDISKYLLECGVDINRKTETGNTALHACAQSGSLDILKMLTQSGAKYQCNSNGTTPLLTAAIKGHSQVVEYFIHEFNCTKQDKVNAIELLGSTFLMDKFDMAKAFGCWKRAMELRYENGGFPLVKPIIRSPIATCIDATEVRNLYELEELDFNPDKMETQAMLVAERILGPDHPFTMSYILINGGLYCDNGNFQRGINLCMYALDVQLKFHYTLNQYSLTLLSDFVALFSSMMLDDWRLERDLQVFQDILHVFNISVRKIERDLYAVTTKRDDDTYYTGLFHDILIAALHLVGLMCRLQHSLNEYKRTELRKAAYELIRLNPKGMNDSTLLHLACCKNSSSLSHYFSVIEFPSAEVVDLLLEAGACPNAVDEDKNTPLHVAAMNMPFSSAICKALVNHGAHLDLCNHERKTPFQLAFF